MQIDWLFERPSNPEQTPPERRILIAALDCIADSGLKRATVRAIAAKAGMNAASVNYYYRSKDKLLETALRSAWIHVSEDVSRIMDAAKSPAEGFEAATRFMIEGAYRYPNIIKAVILEHHALSKESAGYFKALFEGLGIQGGPASRLGTFFLLSFSAFLGIAPQVASTLIGMDVNDASARDEIAGLVSQVFFPRPA